MSATEKYRPVTLNELVGNHKQIKQVDRTFRDYQRTEKKLPLFFFHGPPGIGKTTLARVIAGKYGLKLIETNASKSRRKGDLLEILRKARINTTVDGKKFLILLDEVDGIKEKTTGFNPWTVINEILRKTANPVILIANKGHKTPKNFKSNCTVIEFYHPYLDEVIRRLQQIEKLEGRQLDLSKTTTDVRASINAAISDGDKLEVERKPWEVIEEIFCKGEIGNYRRKEHFYWLLENAKKFYNGRELVTVLQILSLHDLTNDNTILTCLPEGEKTGQSRYSHYLREVTIKYAKN